MKADGVYSQHPSNIPPTSLQTAKNACFSAFPTTSGIRAFLRVKNAREPSKIGRSGCIEGASFLHCLTLTYNPPEQLKIPRWQHRTGSSPVTGTNTRKPFIYKGFRVFVLLKNTQKTGKKVTSKKCPKWAHPSNIPPNFREKCRSTLSES